LKRWDFVSLGEDQTHQLGRVLGQLLEHPALILLQGNLGAGKSVFARGIARGLGVAPHIPITSPTFTLMNHYHGRLDLYHFDLYRLSDSDELLEIGFDDYAYGNGVALVEWPEKMADDEAPGLWITILRIDESRRRLEFVARGENYELLLSGLADLARQSIRVEN